MGGMEVVGVGRVATVEGRTDELVTSTVETGGTDELVA